MSQPELFDYQCFVTVEFDLTFEIEAEDEDDAKDKAEEFAGEADLGACCANIHCYDVLKER